MPPKPPPKGSKPSVRAGMKKVYQAPLPPPKKGGK